MLSNPDKRYLVNFEQLFAVRISAISPTNYRNLFATVESCVTFNDLT